MSRTDVPPIIQAWITQLLDPTFVAIVVEADHRQLDVTLSAAKGKVRREPEVRINSGGQRFVEPDDVLPDGGVLAEGTPRV